jgi:hypothetical protein
MYSEGFLVINLLRIDGFHNSCTITKYVFINNTEAVQHFKSATNCSIYYTHSNF